MFTTPTALVPVHICCGCKNGPLWLEKELETFCAMAKTRLDTVVLFVQSEGACDTEVAPYYTAKVSPCNKNLMLDFLFQWPRSFLYSLYSKRINAITSPFFCSTDSTLTNNNNQEFTIVTHLPLFLVIFAHVRTVRSPQAFIPSPFILS